MSKSLLDAETRYILLKKLALALITAVQNLWPYFQYHSIVVITTYPLKSILQKPELFDRLTKWVIELSEYDISYQPHIAIKSQALANFIADFTPNALAQANKELLGNIEHPASKWTLFVDCSNNTSDIGIGLVLISPEGYLIQQAIRCGFWATNNEVKYKAPIAGLSLAKDIGIHKLDNCSNSQLDVNQLLGTYQARDTKMISYFARVKKLQSSFDEFNKTQVPRLENSHADALANLGLSVPAMTT